MPEVIKRASDPRVASARIVSRHLHNQLLYCVHYFRATRPTDGAAVVLLRDQRPVPSQQGIWRHQGVDLEEPAPTNQFSLCREASSLGVGEQQALVAELLVEHSVLLF